MVQFSTMYAPADRKVHELEERPRKKLEDPIIPISELGVTVPETDRTGKFASIVQNVQAAIRRGTGKLQLVMTEPHTNVVGGRFKGHGREVREAIKEVLLANDAELVGIELPTSLNNLSGLDQQKGVFSEEIRQKHLQEVRDAIKFASDIGQGGEIDIVSFEFPRTVFDAKWNREGKWKGVFSVPEEEKRSNIQFVDGTSGKVQQLDRDNLPPPQGLEGEGKPWKWKEYEELAEEIKKNPGKYAQYKDILGNNKEDWAFDLLKDSFYGKTERQAKRQELYHKMEAKKLEHNANAMKQRLVAKFGTDNEKSWDKNDEEYKEYKFHSDFAEQERIQAKEYASKVKQEEKMIKELRPLSTYAKENSIKSYAEAGIWAMDETHNSKHIKRPIAVGPEIGWPHAYGGHPEEFIELIKSARRKMAEDLIAKRGYTIEQANEQAKMHIKGTFDTGHMGMWLEKFRPELPWDKRVKEFNKWYMDYAKKLADSGTVGGIQLVDAHGAEHAHLPPGQGIFPVVEAAKEFKKRGFTGYMVSEGHEEERMGEGRIMLKTWEAFNSPISTGYSPGVTSQNFGEMHRGYFGRQYAPTQMFGSYTPPSAEYKPWAGGKNPISFE